MSFRITDWLKSGEISPLKWGDSSEELMKLFTTSDEHIGSLKRRRYPYIILDFVEFYFTDEKNFLGLEEIIIKTVSLDNSLETKFIDPDWLTSSLTFDFVSNKLIELDVTWQIERGPYLNSHNIRTSNGVLFAFDPDNVSNHEAELIKIFIKSNLP